MNNSSAFEQCPLQVTIARTNADGATLSRPVVSTILNRLRDKGVPGYNREYVCVRRIEDIDSLIDS